MDFPLPSIHPCCKYFDFIFKCCCLKSTAERLPINSSTGKYFSEALILASTYPQYDKRLFIEVPVQHMKTTSAEHGKNMF